jgi:hypothetical protein
VQSGNEFRVFSQSVKSKREEFKDQKAKIVKKKKAGDGYKFSNRKSLIDSSNHQQNNRSNLHGQQTGTCPGNILSDISRLEVLIGAKRAGNNSPEIINESADICRRLFQGGLMNINLYRELIEELAENHRDNHRDDHEYYSD